MVVKGMVIGIIASAPMGPVGVLCIQRTLNKGRWYGFVTGLGASLSDLFYAIITGYGMVFIFDFIENESNMFWLQLLGSLMLLVFGIYTFRSNPVQNLRPVSQSKGTLWQNGITAFIVTLSNPLIIFLFIAMFARFSFTLPDMPSYEQAIGYVSILIGAVLWWFFVTFFVDKVRTRFDVRVIWILNRVIGVIVIVASIIATIFVFTGFSLKL